MSYEEEFYVSLSYLLEQSFLDSLKEINSTTSIQCIIAGEKAFNVYMRKKYQIPSLAWDVYVHYYYPCDLTKMIEYVGAFVKNTLDASIESKYYRIESLENYSGFSLEGLDLVKNTNPMVEGLPYSSIVMKAKGEESVPFIHFYCSSNEGKIISMNSLYFILLEQYIGEQNTLLLKGSEEEKVVAQKVLDQYEEAVENDGLSCNYYKWLYAKNLSLSNRKSIENCIESTSLGSPDLILGDVEREQYTIEEIDIERHDLYYKNLSIEEKESVQNYTFSESAAMNSALCRFYSGAEEPLPSNVETLQQVILNAPPLEYDTIVYKVARIMFTRNGPNYTYNVGENQKQTVFNSTSFSNWLNFGPFLDDFQVCCAFKIIIKKGNSVFIVGDNSAFPHENEIILPHGCTFTIMSKYNTNVTFSVFDNSVVYDDMIMYECLYSAPENR